MTAIDRAALIEASAAVLDDSYARWCDRVEAEQVVPETEHEAMAEAVLPVIAAGLLAPIRAQIAEWREFMHQPDMTSFEKSAIRMCASELGRLLDQIEADAKGDER